MLKFIREWLWKFMLKRLKHVVRETNYGGQIIVLNTGAIIGPEEDAMLQALHSRSVGGLLGHLKVLAKTGAKKFMASFYIGYGHKSIGDCGTATIFIEGVSMLAAKAIQHWPLYSGQEASTRYIDFAKQKFIDVFGYQSTTRILERWRAAYLKYLPIMVEHFKKRFPFQDGWDSNDYKKAINARAFDVVRGLLPAGASTNLAWHTNLRQAADHIEWLRHHPLDEVRDIAEKMEQALKEAFPSSFSSKRYEATEGYHASWMRQHCYSTADFHPDFDYSTECVDWEMVESLLPTMSRRPPKTELPREVAFCGTVRFQFLLDFGSFRDIQRQRAVTQLMPLLTSDFGFEQWYIDEMPREIRDEVLELIQSQREELEELNLAPEYAQYFHPMGYRIPNALIGDLHALVYLVELRNTRFVHPTLRRRARQMAEALAIEFGHYGLTVDLDKNPDAFDVKRGKHDIVLKK
ncbi:MAG: FAD-dependent thymidylate synthase [Minisyncoccia bacterium]